MPTSTLYVSHGAPPLLEEDRKITEVLRALGSSYRTKGLDAVVVASPHWISQDDFLVQTAPEPPCLQDYYGFPEEYYRYEYPIRNDVELAERVVEEGRRLGLSVQGTEEWGLDHGAWVPLYLMFPDRDLPVVPVSSAAPRSPEDHRVWGAAIARAAEASGRRVLILGTGSTAHRLDQWRFGIDTEGLYPPAGEFDEKLLAHLEGGAFQRVLRIAQEEPELFREAAPEGGLRTLYLSLGAGGEGARARVLSYEPWYYGVSLVALEFVPGGEGDPSSTSA